MLNLSKVFLVFFILISGVSFVVTNAVAADIVDATILQTFKNHNTKFLCLNSPSSLPTIRESVEDHMPLMGLKISISPNDVAKATYTTFPCPFSPYRGELKRATEKDIQGVWLYPETSQKLKYGPKSPLWSKHTALPIKCESVAYYSGGETRNVQFSGKISCPFSKAKDMNASRSNPKVSSWKMLSGGIVKISRTDVANHIEEWETFTVTKPFKMSKILFKKGDLLAYLRKEKGNNFNVATMFRHLQRLP